jgi:ArsR family transcriptional regulator
MTDLDATTERFRILGDPTRVRLIALLREEELSVAELVRITGLPQPRVSTHLRRLREAELVWDRREGPNAWYGMPPTGWDAVTLAAWRAVEASEDPVLAMDRARIAEVLAARERPGTWADSVAGSMDRHYSPGRTWQGLARGLLGLVRLGRVLDVASGDGSVAELIAPRSSSIICIDVSPAVLEAGRRRLRHLENVTFRRGDMHNLPVEDASVDHVLLLAALCFSPEPRHVLAECARVLAPGGDLVISDLVTHAHTELVAKYDHVQQGFEPAEVRAWLEEAGFVVARCEAAGREVRPPHLGILSAHARRLDGARCIP